VKPVARKPAARVAPPGGLVRLRARLAVAEATLRAIRTGETDTLLVAGRRGPRVFTLKGAEHAYRVLIESMNEGALTLTADKTILYANQCFARLVRCPLEQVTGGSLRRFLSAADRAALRPLLKRIGPAGAKLQLTLKAGDGSLIPVQVSIRPLAHAGRNQATVGLVVTDMTEARRTEELLRALTHRVVQVQEAERGSVALELHDHITQQLIAILFRSQALADRLAAQNGPAQQEALKLRALLGHTAAEVERISRHLRPGLLDQLGLVAVLRTTGAEFALRTRIAVTVDCAPQAAPLAPGTELALYRIFQEALKNVERHARARQVTVTLRPHGPFVELIIKDDGIGFDAGHHAARRQGKGVLGLLGMQERAAHVGGTLTVRSGPRAGTEITARIPMPPFASAAA
jgi:PAS domain S-box-containing protein